MAHNLPLGQQPNFGLISTHIHGAAVEIEKCANLPAVQDGNNTVHLLETIQTLFQGMNRRFDGLVEGINNRFEVIGNRFDVMDKRFDAMDNRFDAMDKRFDAMDKRLDAMDTRMDKRFDYLTVRLEGMDERLDDMDKRFDERFNGIDTRLNGVNRHLEGVDKRLDSMEDQYTRVNERMDRWGDEFDEHSTRISASEHNNIARLDNSSIYAVNQSIAPLRDNANKPISQFPKTPNEVQGLRVETLDHLLRALHGQVLGNNVDEKRVKFCHLIGLGQINAMDH